MAESTFDCYCKLSTCLYALNSADNENFSTLLNIAYKAPKGEEVMNDVAFKGYKFMYQQLFGLNGSCDYDHKSVLLDSFHRQQDIAPILIHECNHVRQVERLKENSNVKDITSFMAGLNAPDFIKLNRALEADSCAHQAAFAYQLKDVYPDMFTKEMETPMTQAYAAEMEKSGDETKAMQSSFAAWYDYKHYQEAYEKQFVKQINHNEEEQKNNPALSSKLTSEQIIALCQKDGKPYMTAAFLDKTENMAVSKETKEAIKGTKGADKIPVRGEKQSVSPVLMKKLSNQGR